MVDARLDREIELLHSRICYALAEPKRILILYLLSDGPKRVGELVEAMQQPQSTVSRHLRVLRERGLVLAERKGTAVCYDLADTRIIEALDLLRAVLAKQLIASAALAQSMHDSA